MKFCCTSQNCQYLKLHSIELYDDLSVWIGKVLGWRGRGIFDFLSSNISSYCENPRNSYYNCKYKSRDLFLFHCALFASLWGHDGPEDCRILNSLPLTTCYWSLELSPPVTDHFNSHHLLLITLTLSACYWSLQLSPPITDHFNSHHLLLIILTVTTCYWSL
jgi:hypothetical protein